MKFVRHRSVLFLLVVVQCRNVLAFPLSYTSRVVTGQSLAYIPLITISVSLVFLVVVFLAVKFVYMKHRRIRMIHAPPGTVRPARNLPSGTSSFGFRDKQGYRHRGLLVGCLGSPTWETNLRSKLDGTTWRRGQGQRSPFEYQRHRNTGSTRTRSRNYSSSSRLTRSTAVTSCSRSADQHVLPLWSRGSSQISATHGGSSSRALCSVQRTCSTDYYPRYGDFGEPHDMRLPGGGVANVTRRASPCSIRLVNGPSHSNQVEYPFLSRLPPSTIEASLLMGTRDSFQLSRCSMRCDRQPVPPMPPLPPFLPFCLSKGPEPLHVSRASDYLPPLGFCPLASVAKVLHSQQEAVEKKLPSSRVSELEVGKSDVCSRVRGSSVSSEDRDAGNVSSSVVQSSPALHPTRKADHRRLQPRKGKKGLAISGPLQRTSLVADGVTLEPIQTDMLRSPSGSSRNSSVISRRPLKSCLRQSSAVSTAPVCGSSFAPTPLTSEACTLGTRQSTDDSLWTPISGADIGMLGLDRFCCDGENKGAAMPSCHAKKDSVALVPY